MAGTKNKENVQPENALSSQKTTATTPKGHLQLRNKRIFMHYDINGRTDHELERILRRIKAVLVDFFDKDVDYVVTSRSQGRIPPPVVLASSAATGLTSGAQSPASPGGWNKGEPDSPGMFLTPSSGPQSPAGVPARSLLRQHQKTGVMGGLRQTGTSTRAASGGLTSRGQAMLMALGGGTAGNSCLATPRERACSSSKVLSRGQRMLASLANGNTPRERTSSTAVGSPYCPPPTPASTGSPASSLENCLQPTPSTSLLKTDLLVRARQMGIKILSGQTVRKWIKEFCPELFLYGKECYEDEDSEQDDEKDKLSGVRRLLRPCLKILDKNNILRPCFKEKSDYMPHYWATPVPKRAPARTSSAVDVVEAVAATAADNRPRPTKTSKRPKTKKVDQSGFCECCLKSFKSLYKHMRSTGHLEFAGNQANFRSIDDVINQLPALPVTLAQRSTSWMRQRQIDRNNKLAAGGSSGGQQRSRSFGGCRVDVAVDAGGPPLIPKNKTVHRRSTPAVVPTQPESLLQETEPTPPHPIIPPIEAAVAPPAEAVVLEELVQLPEPIQSTVFCDVTAAYTSQLERLDAAIDPPRFRFCPKCHRMHVYSGQSSDVCEKIDTELAERPTTPIPQSSRPLATNGSQEAGTVDQLIDNLLSDSRIDSESPSLAAQPPIMRLIPLEQELSDDLVDVVEDALSNNEVVAAPVANEDSVAPVAKENSVFPVAKEDCVAPVAKEVSVAPVAKEDCVAPVAKEVSVFPVAKENSLTPSPEVLEVLSDDDEFPAPPVLYTVHSMPIVGDLNRPPPVLNVSIFQEDDLDEDDPLTKCDSPVYQSNQELSDCVNSVIERLSLSPAPVASRPVGKLNRNKSLRKRILSKRLCQSSGGHLSPVHRELEAILQENGCPVSPKALRRRAIERSVLSPRSARRAKQAASDAISFSYLSEQDWQRNKEAGVNLCTPADHPDVGNKDSSSTDKCSNVDVAGPSTVPVEVGGDSSTDECSSLAQPIIRHQEDISSTTDECTQDPPLSEVNDPKRGQKRASKSSMLAEPLLSEKAIFKPINKLVLKRLVPTNSASASSTDGSDIYVIKKSHRRNKKRTLIVSSESQDEEEEDSEYRDKCRQKKHRKKGHTKQISKLTRSELSDSNRTNLTNSTASIHQTYCNINEQNILQSPRCSVKRSRLSNSETSNFLLSPPRGAKKKAREMIKLTVKVLDSESNNNLHFTSSSNYNKKSENVPVDMATGCIYNFR